jgi:hypothetical protein
LLRLGLCGPRWVLSWWVLALGGERCPAPARNEGLESAFECASWQQNAAPALQTLDADVRPEAHDAPFIAAAGMNLAQAHDIVDVYVNWHNLVSSISGELH